MKKGFKKGDTVRVLPRTQDTKTTWCDEMLEMVGKEYAIKRVTFNGSVILAKGLAWEVYPFHPSSLELVKEAAK